MRAANRSIGPFRRVWAVMACVAALCAGAVPVAAQTGRDTIQDTIPKTPQQRILERLRGLRPIGAPDSVLSGDSLRAPAQQVRTNGAGGRIQDRSNAPTIARDSIWESLLRLPGFNATEYRGDTAAFRADSGTLDLRGNALVARDGQTIEAGSITYADSISLACGYGKPRVTGGGMTPVESDSLCYDIERRVGILRGATTTVSEGALWRVRSETTMTRGDNAYSHSAIFTDCDLPWDQVHYHFSAGQVLVKRGNLLVARDVTMTFGDVPVFWLPFLVQSLSQGRRSGVLMPRFGVNDIARTSQRYSRRIEDVGFYWAINDYMGSEVAFDWMSNNWSALRSSFDYNFLDKFVRGGATVRRFWKNEGGTELTIASQNSWEPNERTNLRADVNYSTSSNFIKRNTLDPRELNRSIDSNFSMNRRMDWGSATFGSSRRQFLSDNTVTQVFPKVGLNLSTITLFKATGLDPKWYNNATLTASAEGGRDGTTIGEANTNPTAQTRNTTSGSFRGSFSLGKFALRQSYSLNDQQTDAREIPLETGDSVRLLPALSEQSNRWDVSVDYQQPLVGSITLTPNLALRGETVSNARTNNVSVSSPAQLSFGAGVQADMFGVFAKPVGPFAAFRHRVSPGFSYSYAPKPQADSLQLATFGGLANSLESNRLSFSLSQTLEAKYRETRSEEQVAADSMSADTATGPRRVQEARKLTLLSVRTDALVYDFVQARDIGVGLQTTELANDFNSDLLPGFNVTVRHSLFRPGTATDAGDEAGAAKNRVFSPKLVSANASFSVSGSSWLFRVLRLGRRDSVTTRPGESGNPIPQGPQGGVAVDRTQDELGLVGTRRINPVGTQMSTAGSWTANLNYSLIRPREDAAVLSNTFFDPSRNDQSLRGTVNFQPTANWAAIWETQYSITQGEFSDHTLRLTRKLHDWDANFDFIKAQNGNFSFNFSVRLRANPDIKLDWQQNDLSAASTSRLR